MKNKSVKIFLPLNLFNVSCSESSIKLFGDYYEDEHKIAFYIVQGSTTADTTATKINNLNYIGQINGTRFDNINTNFVHFIARSSSENILLNGIHIIGGALNNASSYTISASIIIVLYDLNKFKNVSKFNNNSNDRTEGCSKTSAKNDIVNLTNSIRNLKNRNNCLAKPVRLCWTSIASILWSFFYLLKIVNFIVSPILNLINPIIRETAVYRHFAEWIQYFKRNGFKRDKLCTIAFDAAAGMLIMYWLLYLVGHPGRYFMQFAEIVVDNLRNLLDSLKGSPVGLKLNVELNNFFLDCFIYHVDLWATFLVVVSPAVQYLFVPLAIFGCFGLSFQLAMLSDLLILISLHAHCFYIYAAVLYHIELVGIGALWRVLLGRRKNILKNRVESHDYTNPQLYLATMFFASLLFFLPTVLIYYLVFASLRLCVYCITYTLVIIKKKILSFPAYALGCWLMGTYLNAENIEITFPNVSKTVTDKFEVASHVSLLQIEPKATSPFASNFYNNNKLNDEHLLSESLLSIDQFIGCLIKSEIMGFIHQKKKIKS